ncbi:hypothetical protein H0H87_007363, partial [Tephrocybe sp. NHM501043]
KLLEKLTKLSDGLFIYASTVVKMVTANNAALIEQVEVLQKIVNLSNHLQLEELYSEIVKKAVSHHDSSVQASRLHVLHTILCAMHPISVSVVADLARTTVEVVTLVVGNLHAVMYKADDGMIYTYHASFADYILKDLITVTTFNPHCNAGMHHEFLAVRCYEIMEEQLCFNICGLESSFVKDVDVPDLEMRIENKISNTLKYAVFKWMAHVNLSSGLHKVTGAYESSHMMTIETPSEVWDIATSPDGKQVVSGSNDQTVCIWDALSGDLVKKLKGHTSSVLSVAFSPDGNQVLSGSSDQTVCIWDALTGDLVKELKGHTSYVDSVAFSPDGKKVVSGSGDQTVCIWDALTGDLVKKLKGHTDWVCSVAFSPDSKQVVSGSHDKIVHIWDALTGNLVKELKGHTDWVRSVAFSPNGKQVVSGSNDQTVRIWDALTGDLVKELKGHTSYVWSVALSPDSKQVVSGSYDGTVRIWDALTGDLVKELEGHTSSVLSVAFFPDGKQVVSGSNDKT